MPWVPYADAFKEITTDEMQWAFGGNSYPKGSTMTENQKYTALVEDMIRPQSPTVPLDDSFEDSRGIIRNLLLTPITSVAEIVSKKGSVRANHYHKTDWHYAYVAKGEVLYFERPIGSIEIPEPIRYAPGKMFYTPPNVEHAMLFAEDSVIFTFAKNVRSHANHESDLVRVGFVTPSIAEKYVK